MYLLPELHLRGLCAHLETNTTSKGDAEVDAIYSTLYYTSTARRASTHCVQVRGRWYVHACAYVHRHMRTLSELLVASRIQVVAITASTGKYDFVSAKCSLVLVCNLRASLTSR